MVATTVRVLTKAARATGAGSMRTTTTRAMTKPSPREEGDDGPPLAARVHNNQILAGINGEECGGDDSKGDDEGGKGDGGRGYKDDCDDNDGDDDNDNGGDDDTKQRQRQ